MNQNDIYYRDKDGNSEFPCVYPQSQFIDFNILDGNNMSLTAGMRIRGKLDLDRFERSLQSLYDYNDALRVRLFRRPDGSFVQKVLLKYEYKLALLETVGDTPQERYEYAKDNALAKVLEPAEILNTLLFKIFMYRIDPDDYFLMLLADHTIFDGSSMIMALNDLFAFYNGTFDPAQKQYMFVEHSKKLYDFQNSEKGLAQIRYWDELKDSFSVIELKKPDGSAFDQNSGGAVEIRIGREALENFARENRTSVANMVLLALQLGIARENGLDYGYMDFSFANRSSAERRNVIGPFVRPLTNVYHVSPGESFREALKRSIQMSSKNIRYADGCLFTYNLHVTFHNFDSHIDAVPELDIQPVPLEYSHKYNFLAVNYWEYPGEIALAAEFAPQLISASSVRNILEFARQALEAMEKDIDAPVYDFVFADRGKDAQDWLEIVKELYRGILETDDVQENSSFFELGGNSLKASYLTAELMEKYGTEILISDIYENETVRELAECIASAEKSSGEMSTPK